MGLRGKQANPFGQKVDIEDLSWDPATQAELDTHTGKTPSEAHGTIVDADVDAAAAIAYSKLDLAASIQEADLAFTTATQAELDAHATNTANPHGVTTSQIGAVATADHDKALHDALGIDAGTLDGLDGSDYLQDPGANPGPKDVLATGWEQVSATRLSLVLIHLHADPSGLNPAEITLNVDVDGQDDTEATETVQTSAGTGVEDRIFTLVLPPGGQYTTLNTNDPDGNNQAPAWEYPL